MASETTVVVTVDEEGRCTIPRPSREVPGIDGVQAKVELHVEIFSEGDFGE